MSELIQRNTNHASLRWKLLTGASALALTTYISSAGLANAEDRDKPTVWVELGGQLSRLDDSSEIFSPPLTPARSAIFSPSQKFESSPRYSFDEYGKISIQPTHSDWIFSAAIQYGRVTKKDHIRQQTHSDGIRYNLYPTLPSVGFYLTVNPVAARFADTVVDNSEQHAILDFQAGKDVGLGLFGGHGSSVVSVGVRFAQFSDKSNISLKSDPDWHFKHKYLYSFAKLQFYAQPYHTNAAGLQVDRSFHGLGPSIAWSSSVPFAGNGDEAELDFDWGLNGAILFGRQKTRVEHHTTVRYRTGGNGGFFKSYGALVTQFHNTSPQKTRSRNVIVPNIGAFAGMSFKYSAAKVSLGYRADFFFNAMDGGIDTRKTYDRNFFGPFATISIGLGG